MYIFRSYSNEHLKLQLKPKRDHLLKDKDMRRDKELLIHVF